MTSLSELILSQYQIRKTRKQKTEFIDLLKKELPDHSISIEESSLIHSRNIIVGDVEKADFILAAHYDTQPVLPFPNFLTPKNKLLYFMYATLVGIAFFGITVLIMGISHFLFKDAELSTLIARAVLGIMLLMMMFGPANKHTANDNTSGVITLIEALHDSDIASKAAFVFFDNEELGLLGSSFFNKKHKEMMKDKLLINFDCVSDGDHIMVILSKPAKEKYLSHFEQTFVSNDTKQIIITDSSNTLYPSDQASFKCSCGVAAFNKNKLFGYYIDKIHTSKDTVFDVQNIQLILKSLKTFSQH